MHSRALDAPPLDDDAVALGDPLPVLVGSSGSGGEGQQHGNRHAQPPPNVACATATREATAIGMARVAERDIVEADRKFEQGIWPDLLLPTRWPSVTTVH